MTAFELGFLILMACGVACIATYLTWIWRHDTAIAERDSDRTALTSTQNALRHAQEAPCGRCDAFATQWAEEVERRLELEHAAAAMIDPHDIIPSIERINQLGTAAHQAWQHAGGRGRTKPEIALLEEFAPAEHEQSDLIDIVSWDGQTRITTTNRQTK